MGVQPVLVITVGNCQAMTASTVPPVSLACLTAQRRAAREDREPSTPTTILGAAFSADICTSPFTIVSAGQADTYGLVPGRAFPHVPRDQGPVDLRAAAGD